MSIPPHNPLSYLCSAVPVVAEVGPGDMLVVPPFWFHHVETLAESVSVNVWSDASEYQLINQVYVSVLCVLYNIIVYDSVL